MKKRIFDYVLGMNLIAITVVLNVRFNVGIGAFSTVMYALSMISKISLGTASIVCYLVFVLVQCLLKRKIKLEYILEVPVSFAFGFLTDFYDFLIPQFAFPYWISLLMFCAAMFITAAGVRLSVRSGFTLTPTDGIVKTVSEVFSIPFSFAKNIFDIVMVVSTVILCLVCKAPFYGIGAGTVLSALLLGRIIKLLEKAEKEKAEVQPAMQ